MMGRFLALTGIDSSGDDIITFRPIRSAGVVLAAAVLALMLSPLLVAEEEQPRHPHLHHALHELREARTELKEANHNFGGHREKALHAVNQAIEQIDKALTAAGDNVKGSPKRPDVDYKKYSHSPHLHHALHELREAHAELKEAKHDFGGHRAKALKDVNHAIEQIELALKSVKR
jgi:hypothetical protein